MFTVIITVMIMVIIMVIITVMIRLNHLSDDQIKPLSDAVKLGV